jgi:toxin ParE1/3/4
MIVFTPDALMDVERLRTFLDQANPGAARRAMMTISTAIERLQEFPDLGWRRKMPRFGSLLSGSAPRAISFVIRY